MLKCFPAMTEPEKAEDEMQGEAVLLLMGASTTFASSDRDILLHHMVLQLSSPYLPSKSCWWQYVMWNCGFHLSSVVQCALCSWAHADGVR